VLGSDSNNDTTATLAEGVDFPVHVLTVNAMGLNLLDYLQFDDLVPLCEDTGRWSFFCVIAPLRLVNGTGSPVNPIAICDAHRLGSAALRQPPGIMRQG
jgi:kynurenine formamidase